MVRSKKYNSNGYKCAPKAYFVSCSTDSKDKIDKFFVENKHYERTLIPIIINGIRVLSIYKYKISTYYMNLVILTKYGTELVGNICGTCDEIPKMRTKLHRYFDHYVDDEDNLVTIKRVIPAITNHFNLYKDTPHSPYQEGNLNKRYLCFFYPIFNEDLNALITILNRIHMESDREMQNGHLPIY